MLDLSGLCMLYIYFIHTIFIMTHVGQKGCEGDIGEEGAVGLKGQKGDFGGEKGEKGEPGVKGIYAVKMGMLISVWTQILSESSLMLTLLILHSTRRCWRRRPSRCTRFRWSAWYYR